MNMMVMKDLMDNDSDYDPLNDSDPDDDDHAESNLDDDGQSIHNKNQY